MSDNRQLPSKANAGNTAFLSRYKTKTKADFVSFHLKDDKTNEQQFYFLFDINNFRIFMRKREKKYHTQLILRFIDKLDR